MNYSSLIKKVKCIVNIFGGLLIGLLAIATIFVGAGFKYSEFFKKVMLESGIELLNVKITGERILSELEIFEFIKFNFLEVSVALIGTIGLVYFFNKLINIWQEVGIFSICFLNHFRFLIIFTLVIGVLTIYTSYNIDEIVYTAVNQINNDLVMTPNVDYIPVVVEFTILLLLQYVISNGVKIKKEQELTI